MPDDSPAPDSASASPSREEARLLSGIAAGESHWVEAFLESHHRPVFALAARLTRDAGHREEWTHVALLRIVDEIQSRQFDSSRPGEFDAWFRRRAYELVLAARREDEAGEPPPAAAADEQGSLPEGEPRIAASDEAAEWASRARLLAGVRDSAAARSRRGPPAPVFDVSRLWLPAAAAIALIAATIAFMQRPAARASRLGGFEVASAATPRGDALDGFHSGDAFVLRMTLSEPGVPVIVTIAGAGGAELIYPPVQAPERVMPAGHLTLPDSTLNEAWTFSSIPGDEVFLAALAHPGGSPFAKLRAELARVNSGPNADRARATVAAMEKFVGPVQRVEVRRLP
jgi:DNA-directed RNA polymerase specialized sigma24 family protein